MEFNFSRIEILMFHKIQNNLQKTINRNIRHEYNFFTHVLLYKLKIHSFVTKFVTNEYSLRVTA